MNLSGDLLTIQKFIFLLDEFHYTEFKNYLVKIKALLPLKLAEAIHKQLPHFDTHEQLCRKIYKVAGKTEKLNFNQLSSYTFKLSANLANNYPEYLHPNIQKIEWLVAEGKLKEANFLNARLLEIAERVNDFSCQIFALGFLSQQAYMVKDFTRVKKTDLQLSEVVETQNLFYNIQSTYRQEIHTTTSPKPAEELNKLLKYFESYHAHPSATIRILSQFAALNIGWSLTPEMFLLQDQGKVTVLRKEIQNNPYLVFPFLLDIKGNLEYMLLNSPHTNVFSKEATKDYVELSAHYDSLKFWKNYLNISELNLIAVQSTKLLSLYHYKIHLSNYQKVIEPADRHLMSELIQKCRAILAGLSEKRGKAFEERSVKMLYSALLILSGGSHIKEGINELEALLINYQQISFKASTDSIFLCLMVGYFSIGDYEKCSSTFKRYLKSIKGKLLFEGNHIKIHAYYYLSRWLETNSKQYPAKLEAILKEHGREGSQRTIWELVNYFNLPIEIPRNELVEPPK